MPPASSSRSSTSTRPAPRPAREAATASPAGPAPTTTTSTSRACRASPTGAPEELVHGRAAVEALAAAVGGARAPAQPVQTPGRDDGRERVADLPERRSLAMADHPPVGRVRGDEVGAQVGPLLGLAEWR